MFGRIVMLISAHFLALWFILLVSWYKMLYVKRLLINFYSEIFSVFLTHCQVELFGG